MDFNVSKERKAGNDQPDRVLCTKYIALASASYEEGKRFESRD